MNNVAPKPFERVSRRMISLPRMGAPSGLEFLTSRERFLNACHGLDIDRPPVWLMRQAGRCLPEYRSLKEKFTFEQLVQTPDLAAEVTLQPIQRFGFDAAIFFSDILVVPEALGQSFHFREKGGVEMEFNLNCAAHIVALNVGAVREKLQYAVEGISLARKTLGDRTALLGFAGAPWTLANFMLEGGSSKEFTQAKALFYSDPHLFNQLMEKLSAAVAAFLQMQIDAGADAVQIFDTHGGILSGHAYEEASGRWIRDIISRLNGQVPVIVFAKGAHGSWDSLIDSGAQILGMDWTLNLSETWSSLPDHIGVQGNLDPMLLSTTPSIVARETNRILTEMRGCPRFIFNLGHGVPPNARLENIGALVTTVQNFK